MSGIPVPVIVYHSIGIPNKNWQWNYLTCPYEVFESQLKWMKKKGFFTISLQELYDYMKDEIKLPKNPIVLTFDDGYLDNWVFAYPLLKKYGFKGTLYVNPEFVDSRNIIRKNLDDVWSGNVEINELETVGYLSWDEIRRMENEKIIDIQSHTMSHAWYPISNRIIDFRHPGDQYVWMTWNENPNKKPFLQIDDEKLILYGKPVYENGRALGIKRFFSDEKLDKYLIQYVLEKGEKDFFKSNNWRDELTEVVKQYRKKNQLNERYEQDEEYEKRILYELQSSKDIIEDKLSKDIKFVCWPGSTVTDNVIQKALEVGYISSPVGKDIIHLTKYLKNRYGEDPSRINRITPVFSLRKAKGSGYRSKYKNGFIFTLTLYNFQEKKLSGFFSRVILTGMSYFYQIREYLNLI